MAAAVVLHVLGMFLSGGPSLIQSRCLPNAEGTPPPQPPTLLEAKGYYDMLSNKSSRISQLIVYTEVS